MDINYLYQEYLYQEFVNCFIENMVAELFHNVIL